MNRKKLFIIRGSVVILVLAGLAAIPFFIDAHSIKTRIIAQLETVLQRKVSVEEAEMAIFTGPAVRLKRTLPARVHNRSRNP